jgi:hypothetical protein
LLAGNVSPELKQEIIKVLTTQAQGMWVFMIIGIAVITMH